MTAAPRRVIAFVNIGHVADHLLMLIYPTAVLGMADGFGLGYGELLALSLGGFIAFGAGSLPAGWLGDHWSRHRMMILFFIGMGAATVLTGFATTPWQLAAGITAMGVFGSIYHPVGTALLTAHAEKLGRAIGINGVWGNLGIAFAALLTGALTQTFGWRTAFIVPGAATMLCGVAYWLLVPDVPAPRRTTARPVSALPRRVVVQAFAVLAVTTVAGSLGFNATVISLPKLFDERLTMVATPMGVGAVASLVYVLGATSQWLVGRLVDRHTLRRVFIPLALLQAPAYFAASLAGGWALVAVAAVMMFAVFAQVTINDTMVAKYTDETWRARAYAIRYLVSFAASAAAVPMVGALHAGTGGFTLVYQVLAVLGAAVAAAAFAFPHRPDEVAAPQVAAAE